MYNSREDDGRNVGVVELVSVDAAVDPVREPTTGSDGHGGQELDSSDVSDGKDIVDVGGLVLVDDHISVLLELDADVVDAEVIRQGVTSDGKEDDISLDRLAAVDVDGLGEGDRQIGLLDLGGDLGNLSLSVDFDAAVLHVLLEGVLEHGVEGLEDLVATDEEVRLGACGGGRGSAGGAEPCRRANLPRALKIPANSTAMYPAPTTTALLGSSLRSKKPSESKPSSAPSMLVGLVGVPPTAMTMRSAVYLRSTSAPP